MRSGPLVQRVSTASKAERLRVRRRRRAVRNVRRSSVSALLRLAEHEGRDLRAARALRAAARRLERVLKRVEVTVAPREPVVRSAVVDWDEGEAAREYRQVLTTRAREAVTVDQPLVLITQAPRSGGTLLMRLFDGHPACHAIGHELGSLLPTGLPLPPGADGAWSVLADHRLPVWFAEGLRQAKGRRLSGDGSWHPFLLPPLLHRQLFELRLAELRPDTDRGVVDCYLTAYFNAWLDYCGLHPTERQRWVTGFEPSAIVRPDRLRCFRELYPDGRLVSVVRDPAGWIVSASRRNRRYADREVAVRFWRETVEAALALHEQSTDSVAIVSFESLVGDTPGTMAALAGFLGIECTPALFVPTWNGVPMKANSSFPVEQAGIIAGPATRGAELSAEDAAVVEEELGPLHRRALDVALVARPG